MPAAPVSFLFWNIRRAQGTRFAESLRRLASHGIDVFLLAEPPPNDASLLEALNNEPIGSYHRVESDSRRLMLFSKLENCRWVDRFSGDPSDRITVHELKVGNQPDILLVGAHLRDPLNHDANDRAEWARHLVPQIRRFEKDAGHSRTILVGDLNMNPFDQGLVATTALHALMTRKLTKSVQRLAARRDHLPFYNPMWSLLGDRVGNGGDQARVAGTYFYEGTRALGSHFWQMFDQVLLRPSLMDSLVRLEILESDGHNSFVSQSGRPRRRTISDHLPIRFELRIPD